MYLRRLICICLICASMLMVGLNKSWDTFGHIEPNKQSPQNQASEHGNSPEVTRYYVARSGNNTNGSSWEKAFTSVQAALIVATVNGGGEIWVAKGVYYPDESMYPDNSRASTFVLQNNISLYGGFDTKATKLSDRNWEKNVTVLSGDIDGNDFTDENGIVLNVENINGNNAINVVTANGVDNTAILDGFTVTAGDADREFPYHYGGGFNCDGSGIGNKCTPNLRNITFSGNSAKEGGAMYNNGSQDGDASPTLEDIIFLNNFADVGGAITNHAVGGDSSPILINVQFLGNSANFEGGAMFNNGIGGNSSPILKNVSFLGNKSVYLKGGAMYNHGINNGISNPILTNVIFSGNYAQDYGGAMYNNCQDNGESSPKMTNTTFSGNSTNGEGGAMYNNGSSDGTCKPQVRNSIIWNNMDMSGIGTIGATISNLDSMTYIVNTNSQGTGGSNNWTSDSSYVDGGGNLDKNPLFVKPVDPSFSTSTDGNLRLKNGSPAIDKGENTYIAGVITDLDGQPRIIDGDGNGTATVDMGAYEYLKDLMYLPLILN